MNSIDKAKEIISNSGNNFHCKVLNYLKSKGWHVLISPYYTDNVTDKPREIDLIAEKAFDVHHWAGGRVKGSINIKLFIECKFVPNVNVLWFDNNDREKCQKLIKNTTKLQDGNIAQHHYLQTHEVAKLFASSKDKNVENEIIYKALNQSLNAMVYRRWERSIIPEKQRRKILRTIEYPVIVCNSFDGFYKVNISSQGEPEKINDNFLLEVNYAYLEHDRTPRSRYFIIDFISFDKIDDFLDLINSDIKIVKHELAVQ